MAVAQPLPIPRDAPPATVSVSVSAAPEAKHECTAVVSDDTQALSTAEVERALDTDMARPRPLTRLLPLILFAVLLYLTAEALQPGSTLLDFDDTAPRVAGALRTLRDTLSRLWTVSGLLLRYGV